MEPPVFKYRDYKEIRKSKSYQWFTFFDAEASSWKRHIVRFFLFPLRLLLLPFKPWLIKGIWASGHQVKLYRKRKFQEAYSFGMDRLLKMNCPKVESSFWVSYYHGWWEIFRTTCTSAMELPGTMFLKILSEVAERGPKPHSGYEVSEAYANLSRLAWHMNDSENTWFWIEKSVESDDSNGSPYMLRAWFGQLLKRGQPLADLIMAIQHQPELEDLIFKDEMFLKEAPDLLKSLKSEASAPSAEFGKEDLSR